MLLVSLVRWVWEALERKLEAGIFLWWRYADFRR